ncbi:MAG: hypothetical protein JST47_16305 [Bacteroidetes bacterium]|nr:hypothetical protein [Bacteroidota bacterium]
MPLNFSWKSSGQGKNRSFFLTASIFVPGYAGLFLPVCPSRVEAGIVDKAEEYLYSSARDYFYGIKPLPLLVLRDGFVHGFTNNRWQESKFKLLVRLTSMPNLTPTTAGVPWQAHRSHERTLCGKRKVGIPKANYLLLIAAQRPQPSHETFGETLLGRKLPAIPPRGKYFQVGIAVSLLVCPPSLPARHTNKGKECQALPKAERACVVWVVCYEQSCAFDCFVKTK